MSKLTIKRPERTVALCLDADLQAQWEKAEADLNAASARTLDDRLTGGAAKTKLAEAVQEIEERMRAGMVRFTLRALPRSEWAACVARNAPREDDQEDKVRGFNRETFFDDVITRSIVAVEQDGETVEFDPAEDWQPLADEMTDRQYSNFADAVFLLNRGEVSIPFSKAASRSRRA